MQLELHSSFLLKPCWKYKVIEVCGKVSYWLQWSLDQGHLIRPQKKLFCCHIFSWFNNVTWIGSYNLHPMWLIKMAAKATKIASCQTVTESHCWYWLLLVLPLQLILGNWLLPSDVLATQTALIDTWKNGVWMTCILFPIHLLPPFWTLDLSDDNHEEAALMCPHTGNISSSRGSSCDGGQDGCLNQRGSDFSGGLRPSLRTW